MPKIQLIIEMEFYIGPMNHSDTMLVKATNGTVGSVGTCQVLPKNKINLSIKGWTL